MICCKLHPLLYPKRPVTLRARSNARALPLGGGPDGAEIVKRLYGKLPAAQRHIAALEHAHSPGGPARELLARSLERRRARLEQTIVAGDGWRTPFGFTEGRMSSEIRETPIRI